MYGNVYYRFRGNDEYHTKERFHNIAWYDIRVKAYEESSDVYSDKCELWTID